MADEKAGDMDFNFSDANFDMGDAGGAFEMPSMDDLGGGADGAGDFKFDAGDDGGFNFGDAGGDAGADFNFDNMSMPSFSGDDNAADKKDVKSGSKGGDAGGASKPKVAVADAMADDPLNTIADLPDMPDIGAPMSLVDLSQEDAAAAPQSASQDNGKLSQGSNKGGSSSQPKSQGSTRSSRRLRNKKGSSSIGSGSGASKKGGTGKQQASKSQSGGAATGAASTPAKAGRSKPTAQMDEEQKDTPSKDMAVAGTKRRAEGETIHDSGKKPKTPEQPVIAGARSKATVGEPLRATKDMMCAEGAPPAPAASAGNSGAASVPQTPSDSKKEKKSSHHKSSSSKSRSSKKRSSGGSGLGANTTSGSSSNAHHKSGDHSKKHKSKSGSSSGNTSPGDKKVDSATEEVSLQQIVGEAQSRMNEITEAMTRIEKELHQKTSQLAAKFVQQMFGMCNNFGMTCQQQILAMNQVAYRNDQLRKNVCKALELSNRLRGMQQMKNQLSSIKDSFCPNL